MSRRGDSKAAIALAAGAVAAAAFLLFAQKKRPKRWLRLAHYFEQEDEAGDEQETDHEPSNVRRARASNEKIDGAAKCFSTVGYNQQLCKERQATYDKIQHLHRLPELDYVPSAQYVEAPIEEVLHPLIESSGVILVPGAFFGDEGKGKTVDAIARHPAVTVVARVNSGENAGHTVVSEDGHKYDFHLCPSGLLTPGKVNVIGPECVMDPVSFMTREVSQLQNTNVSCEFRRPCPIPPSTTLPWYARPAAADPSQQTCACMPGRDLHLCR